MGPDTAEAAAEEGTHEDGTATRPAPARGSGRPWWARADPALVGLTLAGLVLRAWGIGAQSLWFDEWLTQSDLGGGPIDLVRNVANREGHPVPYFAVLWVWSRVFGDGEAALRSVSMLAGVATIPVAYALVHRLARRAAPPGSTTARWPARAAALLLAVNPLAVWYSQEARPYALLCLAGGLLVLAAARAVEAEPLTRRDVGLLAAATAATMAVHYFGIFLVVAVGVGLVALRRDAWRTWLLAGVPTVVVLAAQAPVALRQHSYEAYRTWITAFPLRYRLADAGRSVLVGPAPPRATLWVVVLVVVVAGVAAGLWRARPAERRAVGALAAVGAGAVALALAAVVVIDAVVSRYLIASLVPLVAAVALAAGAPRRGLLGRVGPGAVVVVAALSLTIVVADARDEHLQRPDWRSVARAFEEEAASSPGPRALVVTIHGTLATPLTAYLDDARVLGPDDRVEAASVDVVVAMPTDVPCDLLAGRACGFLFLGALPDPLRSRLGAPDRRVLGQFALDRFRPPGPVTFGPRDVAATEGAHTLVLVAEGRLG